MIASSTSCCSSRLTRNERDTHTRDKKFFDFKNKVEVGLNR